MVKKKKEMSNELQQATYTDELKQYDHLPNKVLVPAEQFLCNIVKTLQELLRFSSGSSANILIVTIYVVQDIRRVESWMKLRSDQYSGQGNTVKLCSWNHSC